jgi:hypothetical protein
MSRWYRVLLALLPSGLSGQSAQDSSGASAESCQARYKVVTQLAPIPDRVVPMHHLVLQRDVARNTLEQGELYPLTAIGGRTVGAVFRGQGCFTPRPPIATAQAVLQRWDGAAALDDAITEAILIFADTTGAQLDTLLVPQ